jgi:2-polyprenyl-3-methyl-5-hydroxy-6-metoxy-1,4-benzoquinol methylase
MQLGSEIRASDSSVSFEQGAYGVEIFNHGTAEEEERLTLIEEEQDPYTCSCIEALGPQLNWQCLEVGAGRGSMAAWLAERCPEGQVVALDLDTKLLDTQGHHNIEVRQQDILTAVFTEGTFDLIHARAVLTHLKDPEAMCQKMAGWLRPGGWLFICDPASFPVDSSPHPLMRKIGQAAAQMMQQAIGTDPNWSRSYPAPLMRAGLVNVDSECRLRMMQGGTREATMFDLMLSQIGGPIVASGLVTAHEMETVRQLLHDPSFVDFPPAVVRAWGRKP